MPQVFNQHSHSPPISEEEKRALIEKIQAYRGYIHINSQNQIDEIALSEDFE